MNPVRKKILKESALNSCIYILVFALGDLVFALISGDPISEEMKPLWKYAIQMLVFFVVIYGLRCFVNKDL